MSPREAPADFAGPLILSTISNTHLILFAKVVPLRLNQLKQCHRHKPSANPLVDILPSPKKCAHRPSPFAGVPPEDCPDGERYFFSVNLMPPPAIEVR